MKPLYTATVTVHGGREGHIKSEDGILDFDVRSPKELGGSGERATNPRTVIPADRFTRHVFDSALNLVRKKKEKGRYVRDGKCNDRDKDEEDGGFKLAVRLDVSIPDPKQGRSRRVRQKSTHDLPLFKSNTRKRRCHLDFGITLSKGLDTAYGRLHSFFFIFTSSNPFSFKRKPRPIIAMMINDPSAILLANVPRCVEYQRYRSIIADRLLKRLFQRMQYSPKNCPSSHPESIQ